MTRTLAIDPGNTESGWVLIDDTTRRPIRFGKWTNERLRESLAQPIDDFRTADTIAIEMVASYGMSVGADVFETCVWIGRFIELTMPLGTYVLVKRLPVKVHHCHSAKATDSNIRQALVDRFAAGKTNHGKGTKAEPGWFYGFHADIWQAYALAVYVADVAGERPEGTD